MKTLRQWLLWDLIQGEKLPLHPLTLVPHDAHDPTAWISYDEAVGIARAVNKGVAFVFTATDPYFFIDIDDAAVNGQWAPWALDICNKFSGCEVEVSQSGNGLHLFGRYTGPEPKHRIKPLAGSGINADLFTSKRFVAYTGNGTTGNCNIDFTPVLTSFITEYYDSKNIQTDKTEWTTEPVPEWSGPEDDDELINKMLRSKSAGAAMGSRVSIKALWEADETELAQFYPDEKRPFDWSKADSALCTHLAWWTGKNSERIDRLFRRSGLCREKWLEREQYRVDTIGLASGITKSVYNDRKSGSTEGSDVRVGYQFLTPAQQIEYFAGCVYVRDSHAMFVPDGRLLKPDQFRATYGGYVFSLDAMNDKVTLNAWQAFTESQAHRFPRAISCRFRPELPPGQIFTENGEDYINTYVPVVVEKEPGDITPFLDHIARLLPDPQDQTIILSYMAACVQYPGVKFRWAPLIQGAEGNGKTFLAIAMEKAIGSRYTHWPNAADLTNKFNGWLAEKLLIIVEDIYAGGNTEIQEVLKPWMTNPRTEIQRKGQNQTSTDNRARFMFFANSKGAVRKTVNTRRFSIFYSAQQSVHDIYQDGLTGPYFIRLYGWLENGGYKHVNHWLYNYAIPEQYNPATQCVRAPQTSTESQVLAESLGPLEQEVNEAVGDERPGFSGGWISSMALADLFKGRKISHNRRKEMLHDLGYIPHPSLPDGRVTGKVPVENGRPRLYVKVGSILLNMTDPVSIKEKYITDQGYVVKGGLNARSTSSPVG